MPLPPKRSLAVAFSCWLGLIAPAYPQHNGDDPVTVAQDLIAGGKGREAKSVLQPLAISGDPEAAYWLGRLYYYDVAGVPQNYRRSAYWFALSARTGHSGAQYKLGGMYFSGRGVPKNFSIAATQWRAAALQRHPEALNNLGALLATGQGVGKNPELGLVLQITAADMGSEAAQSNVRNKGRRPAATYMKEQFLANPAALDDRLMRVVIDEP